MSTCPTTETLARLLSAGLPAGEAEALREHLTACARCQAALDQQADDPELRRWAAAYRTLRGDAPDEPALALLLDQMCAGATPEPSASDTPLPPLDASLDFLTPSEYPNELGMLGPYRVLGVLGRGGMGVVLRAFDPDLRRTVALKVLPPDRADARARARFIREAQAAAGIEHDHVVPVHAVANPPDGPPYLVMPYVDGVTLRERIKAERRLGPHEVARIGQQVAEGLAAAHRAGLVHRDIKPSNIILERGTGRARIMDFGLVRILSQPGGTTREGTAPGTPEYMSPEQVRESDHLDARSDVYSLGVTLYEALTGDVPFRGVAHMVLQQILNDEPRPPRRLNDAIPRDVETICLRCLQKEPGKRYPSADALADDLRRFLAGEPILARPIRLWERTVKWARRRPAVAALLALVVGVTALGFGLVTWQWQRAEGAGLKLADKVQELADKTKELEIKHYVRNIALAVSELSTDNLGRAEELLDECPEKLRGWDWHYVRRLRYAKPIELARGARVPLAGNNSDVAFSPDGQLLAAPAGDNVKVWEAATGREVFVLRGHTDNVRRVALRPDGRWLASTGADSTVKVWDMTTGLPLCTLAAHTEAVSGLTFSPDGRLLGTASRDNTVRLWDPAAGTQVHRFAGGYRGGRSLGLAFSPDGAYLACGGENDTVKLWDVRSGQAFRTLVGHAAPVFTVAFSPDGRRLASADLDFVVRIWEIPSGRPLLELPPVFDIAIWGMAYSPDGRRLAVGSGLAGGGVSIFDMASGQRLLTLEGHVQRCTSVAWSPDGQRLVSSSMDRTIKVWEMERGQEVLTLRGHRDLVGRVVFDALGRRLASCSEDGTVRIWDATPAEENADRRIQTLRGDRGRIWGIAFSPDGRLLATAGEDKTLKVWDTTTGQELFSLLGHTGPLFNVAFGPHGLLASASVDKTVKLWDVRTRQETRTLPHQGAVRSLALSRDGRRLVTCDFFATAQVWDTITGDPITGRLSGTVGFIHNLAYSPDGIHVAGSSAEGVARLWNSSTGQLVHVFRGHLGRVHSVTFCPDGRRLASGDSDQTVIIWDLATRTAITKLTEHTHYVYGLAFSPNGKYFASASWREVIVWDAHTFAKLTTLRGLAGEIFWVTFSPDSQRLAASGGYKGKGEIKIWDATLWDNQASGGRKPPE